MSKKHKWKKSTNYSIKCEAGHYIARTHHANGITKYSLFPDRGEKVWVFDSAAKAKEYCNKKYPAKGVSS